MIRAWPGLNQKGSWTEQLELDISLQPKVQRLRCLCRCFQQLDNARTVSENYTALPESVHSQPRAPFSGLCLSRNKIVPLLSLALHVLSHSCSHSGINVQTKKCAVLFHIQDTNRRQTINCVLLGLRCFPPLGPVATLFTCLLVRQIRVQIALGFVHIRFAVLSQEISRQYCMLDKVDTQEGDYSWPCTGRPCSAWTRCLQFFSLSAPPLIDQFHLNCHLAAGSTLALTVIKIGDKLSLFWHCLQICYLNYVIHYYYVLFIWLCSLFHWIAW